MTGLEYFRAMLEGRVSSPPMVSLLGLRMVEADPGRIVFAGTVTEQFYNGWGVAHGGFAATMLDTALTCAINTTSSRERTFTTLELKINFVRPLTREAGEVRCEGRVIHAGNRIATAEGRIVGPDGKLYAHGTTTCISIEQGSQGSRGSQGAQGS